MTRPPGDGGRIQFLEGLRGIAVILVILFHAEVRLFTHGGYLGVNTFFVLSGFIITHLLLREWDGVGRISLPSFYQRRVLRLMPALLALFIGCLLIWRPLMGKNATILLLKEVGLSLPAVYNLAWVGGWLPNMNGGYLGHTWSLSLEWQFYLGWPLVLIALLRWVAPARQAFVVLGLALCGLLVGWCYLQAEPTQVHNLDLRLETRMFTLLAGAACAFVVRGWGGRTQGGSGLASGLGWAALALLLLPVLWYRADLREYLLITYPVSTGLAAAVILCGLRWPEAGPTRLLAWPPLVWAGKLSYSLYLWHWPVFCVFISYLRAHLEPGQVCAPWWMQLVLLLAATPIAVLLAWLSYRYVEMPMMGLRHRLHRDQAPA